MRKIVEACKPKKKNVEEDVYYEKEVKIDWEAELTYIGKKLAEMLGADKKTVEVEHGMGWYLTVGDRKEEGIELSVSVHNDGTLDRIIMSADVKGIYYESREPELLETLRHDIVAFQDWIDEAEQAIEDRVARKYKADKAKKEKESSGE